MRRRARRHEHGPTLMACLETIELDEARAQHGPLRLPVLPITLALSLLVALLAAIVPVRRAVSVEPAKVLKGE